MSLFSSLRQSFRYVAPGVGAVVVGALLLASPLASLSANGLPLSPDAVATAQGASTKLELTPMPAFSGTLFPIVERPDWLNDPDELRYHIEESLVSLGHPEAPDELWSVLSKGSRLQPDTGAYPWTFDELDALTASFVTPDNVTSRRNQLNDLAAMLILLAERPVDPSGNSVYTPGKWVGWAPAAGYSILRRVRQLAGVSCLVQLNLAFAVTLREESPADGVKTEFETAAEACPDDPTPLYLLGYDRLARMLTLTGCATDARMPEDFGASATAIFARAAGPDLAHGFGFWGPLSC